MTWKDGISTFRPLTLTCPWRHQLPCLTPRHRKPEPVYDIVETPLEHKEEDLARYALLAHGLLKVVAELTLEQVIDALDALLLAQLLTVAEELAASRVVSVLSRAAGCLASQSGRKACSTSRP